MSHEKL